MKISDTNDILKVVDNSEQLVLKIGMGNTEKAMWCPSFKAQKSHSTQAISDSIWETFASVDCHLRNLNSVSSVESYYAEPHIYIGTTKSIEKSNITPDFIEKLAKMMSDRWEKVWNEQRFWSRWNLTFRTDMAPIEIFKHLFPIPKEAENIGDNSHIGRGFVWG